MSTTDITGTFQVGDFDLNDATSMDASLFPRVCMQKAYKHLKSPRIRVLAKFVQT